jgi:clan AA aspartic protease (TIGR02281 family)
VEANGVKGAVWLAVFLAVVVAAGSAGAVDVPLKGHGRALVVEATLNGRYTGRFLVDTGATYCVVSKDVAREAKIKGRVGPDAVRLMTANGPVEADLGEARKIEVGDASASDIEVAVTKEPPVPGLAGVLGLSFLGRFTYSVDSKAGVLKLKR